MVTSLDGKVTGSFLTHPACAPAEEIYYEINRAYRAEAFACGRVTMEGSFTGGFAPDLSPFAGLTHPRADRVADPDARFFAVAFDRRGRLGWRSSRIHDDDPGYDDAHIIEVLCEDAPDAYLCYLDSIGVSYIFAGAHDMDVPLALEKLCRLFDIQTLLLEGGSVLNGAFAAEDLMDEVSLVVAPLMADGESKPLFEKSVLQAFSTVSVTPYESGVVCLNYKK
jgi:riboflavin biosynthesis pyrimidine reductase